LEYPSSAATATTMPQTTLTSFFGGNPPPKKKNPQTKLDSFFGKKKKNTERVQGKENSQNKRTSPAQSDAESDTKKTKLSTEEKLKRRVIDDDSDSDDDNEVTTNSDKNEEEVVETNDTTNEEEVSNEKKEGEEEEKEDNDKKIAATFEAKNSPNKRVPDLEETTKAEPTVTKSAAKMPVTVSKPKAAEKSNSSKKVDSKSTSASSASLDYATVCEAFEKIEALSSRLEIQQIVTKLFREQIEADQTENLYPLMYLLSNSVAPAYECVELGIGDALLIKAIAEAYGATVKSIKEKYEELGDLGQVAQSVKGKLKTLGGFFAKLQATKPLGCQEILTTFRDIANMKGNQSQKHKIDKIKKMLVRVTNQAEPKYIIRALQGKLRIGLAESTVLISLAQALTQSIPSKAAKVQEQYTKSNTAKLIKDFPQEAKEYCNTKVTPEKRMEAAVAIVKKAYSEVPSYDALIDACVSVPLQELHKVCTLTPGVPVAPMLAKPTKSILEVLTRLNGQRFTCEYKYDGERAQVHMLEDGSFRVYSRSLLDTSAKYPEVPKFVKEAAGSGVTSFVCDTEVVAYDVKKEKLVPFQVLSTRKKTEESAETAKVQVIVQAFDLMYLNGESLLGRTLAERRDLLRKHFSVVPGKFNFAISLDHQEDGDTTVIEEFLDAAVKGQCEGLMVKTLDDNSHYEPSKRSLNWLKLKKDYLEGLGDSVDLVPIGAYHGKGKRTGFYGAYLLACYDPDTEEFQSVWYVGFV